MRVFITSTPDELEPFQEAAIDVVRELGHEPMVRDPAKRYGLDPVSACRRQVALAGAVLAVVGWRRGRVPPPALGGAPRLAEPAKSPGADTQPGVAGRRQQRAVGGTQGDRILSPRQSRTRLRQRGRPSPP